MINFNVLILGDQNVGKSTLIKRFKREELIDKYISTYSVDISKVGADTTSGPINLMFVEYAGDWIKSIGMESQLLPINLAVIMFDASNIRSYFNVCIWYSFVRKIYGDIPVILVCNKVDKGYKQMNDCEIHRSVGIPYYNISAVGNFNIGRLFRAILRTATNNNKLEIIQLIDNEPGSYTASINTITT